MSKCEIFEERRKNEPQAVIDALIAQTTRQAVEINKLNKEIAKLKAATEVPLLKKGKKDAV